MPSAGCWSPLSKSSGICAGTCRKCVAISMRRDQREMRDDLQSLKADVSLIPGMRRDIDLILESQQGINEKFAGLDLVTEDVAGLHIRVSALEGASRSHTEEIRELRLAK